MLQHEIESLQQELIEIKKTNKDLLVYKQQLDAILNNAPVEVYLKDREGRYLRINKEFEKIFGVKSEELIGCLPCDVHDSELAVSTRNHDLLVLRSGVAERREETASLVGDDQMHTLLTIKFPVFNDDGEVDGLGAIVTDITEQKQMEETLRRAQKMDAIGQLTGGIAHDFNNILCIVMGNLELMESHIEKDGIAFTRLKTAYKSASRGAALIRKLLSFSSTRGEMTKLVSLNTFLSGMEALITQSLTVSIETKMLLENNLWTVEIDPGELEDAILNLSLNARDAMPDGGQMTIQTANVIINPIDIWRDSQLSVGNFVMLSVCDNGAGMTSDVQKKATEPFFTTKATDQGTGLGLSMVHSFVYRSGGHMRIKSEPGKGTEIEILLPQSNEETQKETLINQPVSLHYGDETILVVDDEQALADIAVSYLQNLGYKTFIAHDSNQALRVLNANPSIDLMFTDVIMPGEMDGYELAVKAKQTFPVLKVLITSGFTKTHDDFSDGEVSSTSKQLLNLLRKPYDKLSLSSAIRAVLDTHDNSQLN
ncbi:MAG: PAS domain S-box-containing protein [bacterium]|jgi:PAS domain S-box-containing protein